MSKENIILTGEVIELSQIRYMKSGKALRQALLRCDQNRMMISFSLWAELVDEVTEGDRIRVHLFAETKKSFTDPGRWLTFLNAIEIEPLAVVSNDREQASA